MKRMLSAVLCLALLLTLCLSGAAPLAVSAETNGLLSDFENEVYNGFWWENASYGMLGNTGTPASVEQEDNGNHYLYMPAGEKNYARYYNGMPIEAGKTYCLSLRYKGTGFAMQYQSCAEGGGLLRASATTEWTDYSHVFTFTDPLTVGVNYAIVFWNITGGSGVCIDDVYLTEVVDTEGVTFADGKSLTLAKGDQHRLTLQALPEGAMLSGTVAYKSDNAAAVTVSADGLLTAVAPGIANIVATVGDFSAVCTVTVDQYASMLLGDFEGELSAGWTWANANYGMINSSSPMSVDSDATGNHFLKIPPKAKADGTGNDAYYRLYLNAPVTAGKTYRVTFRYKGSGAQLYLMSNGVATGAGMHILSAADGWTTYTKTFTTKDPANDDFTLGFRHTGADGTTYVDDVYLEEVAPFDNHVIDGDFEAEVLSPQWNAYLAESQVAIVSDTVNGGSCMRVDGKKWPYLNGLSSMQAGSSYKLSFKLRGNGRAVFYFHTAVENSMKVSGVSSTKYSVSGKYVYITTDSDTEWTECTVTFRLALSNQNYNVSFGGYNNDSTYMYFDDVSVVELGNAYVQGGLVGGAVSMNANETDGTLLSGLNDGETASTVTVTVTPNEGYILVPGSLRYITSNGITKRILNKNGGKFGEGNGMTYAFEAPNENIRLIADFVSTAETNFAFGTVGTAVHINGSGTEDGIRFLNRVQLTAFDETADGFTFNYQGEQYTVSTIGMLLKRADVHYSLDLETYDQVTHDAGAGAVKMWGVEVYNSETNAMRLVDYTDNYLDFCIALVTSSPDASFCERLYTARSYIVLEKDGVKTVLYANERTDSVDTTLARAAGTLSDDVTVDDDSVGTVDPSTPIPEDDLADADLKILCIGNSWSHNATSYLADIAAANGKTVKMVNLFKSGCSLQQHWAGYEENLPQYWYELNGVIDWNSAVTLKAALTSDDWDIIVTQAGPTEAASDEYAEPLENLVSVVKKSCPNAKIYLHQTWAFGNDYAHLTAATGLSMDEMWAKVQPNSETIAAAAALPLIPGGTAAYALEKWFEENEPTLSFYQTDNSHASDTWGWYLLALVWYQTLTGEVPNDTFTDFDSDYTDDPVIRAKVHEIAQASVAQYATEA